MGLMQTYLSPNDRGAGLVSTTSCIELRYRGEWGKMRQTSKTRLLAKTNFSINFWIGQQSKTEQEILVRRQDEFR